MKKLFNKFLLLFGKKRSRVEVEGCFRYKIEYKMLFGNEYILYKALPAIDLTGGVKLPFDFST